MKLGLPPYVISPLLKENKHTVVSFIFLCKKNTSSSSHKRLVSRKQATLNEAPSSEKSLAFESIGT